MTNIGRYIPLLGLSLAHYSGKQVIDRLGTEAIQEAVASVLCGYNLRSLTENLTRRRLTLSNGAMIKTFIDAASNIKDFSANLIPILKRELLTASSAEKKVFLFWIAGLTNKSVQNVLRSDRENIDQYLDEFKECIEKATKICQTELGQLEGSLNISNSICALDWLLVNYLSTAIGAQTLAIRGSEKSMYGKMFEPLILSTLLQILGFEKVNHNDNLKKENVFWLSHRKDKRESDATLLYKPGQGIYFDIGFIGPGNPEITLDKVSRFESHLEYGKRSYDMLTIIIVDRIGENSRIVNLAKQVNGHIIQMSMSHWVKDICKILNSTLGYEHEILHTEASHLEEYIKEKVKKVHLFIE